MVYAAEAGAFDALAQDLLEDLAADLGYGLERLRGVAGPRAQHPRGAGAAGAAARRPSTASSTRSCCSRPCATTTGTLVDLRYVEANAAAVTYNRYPREQLIGARLLDLFPGQLENGPLRLYFRGDRDR